VAGLPASSQTGIALGTARAGVLFTGLAASHFGLRPETGVAHFLKDFGLVLFVFALGMQMGPGFFTSLRQHGRLLNAYAFALVVGGALVALLGGWWLGSTRFCSQVIVAPGVQRPAP